MSDLRNTLSWSFSRATLFERCPRAYWYHYYGSFGGWKPDADPTTAELWLLKKLTGRQAWAGSATHAAIEWALGEARTRAAEAATGASPQLPPLEETLAHLRAHMRSGFRASRAGAYRRPYRGPRPLSLLEHEYGVPVPDAVWKETFEHACRCIENFYRDEAARELISTPPERWRSVEELHSLDYEGVRVYFVFDAAFEDEAGRLRILDWKTGRPREKDTMQLCGYAYFAQAAWQVPWERTRCSLHYLATGETLEVPIGRDEVEGFEAMMRASIAAMRAALTSETEADPARLPPRPDPAACRRCPFARVCPDAAGSPADLAP